MRAKQKLPECGLFLGSGVYSHGGKLVCSGKAFTYWAPDFPTAKDTIELVCEANQGNTLQFWQHNQELLDLAKAAAEKGIYSMCIYSSAPPEISAQFKNLGGFFIGYDFGERYTFTLYESNEEAKKQGAAKQPMATLRDLAHGLMKNIREHVEERRKTGWGLIMTTGSKFHMDYEIAAGADVPLFEDFGLTNLMVSAALSRGLYRQYDLPIWGAYLAHEWYSWFPQANPLKFPSFQAAMRLKYLTGAKIIINESGNWALQSSLCPDSPMHTMPRVEGDPPGLRHTGPEIVARHIDEARKLFCNIDYRSPTAVKYRKEISDFYNFVKANPAPKGQPETTVALAKGNFDLCANEHSPETPVAHVFGMAKQNPDWFEGAPERGWDIVKSVFYPRPPILGPNKNLNLAGAPYGMVDIVSFADDRIDAEFLKNNYKALIFSGWNTCSPKQYSIFVDYVKAGGKLCLGIPHLSCDATRNYRNYTIEDLVNGGDFSELCGLKVKGCGERFYWATGAERAPNALGLAVPRRYGIIGAPLGDIEITDPDSIEVLAADDEKFQPFIIRRRLGKGEVFFINSWSYPGALNKDDGPGCTVDSKGLMGLLYAYIATISRGHVWITGQNAPTPDADCEHIAFSYFPDAGKICLQNMDFKNSRRCTLHHFGDLDPIELTPAEFRILDSVVLKPGEKFNSE